MISIYLLQSIYKFLAFKFICILMIIILIWLITVWLFKGKIIVMNLRTIFISIIDSLILWLFSIQLISIWHTCFVVIIQTIIEPALRLSPYIYIVLILCIPSLIILPVYNCLISSLFISFIIHKLSLLILFHFSFLKLLLLTLFFYLILSLFFSLFYPK